VVPNYCLKRPVTKLNSQPGKAGFRVSGLLLLGGGPPFFDELLQHLAAIAQALAFLDLVKKSDRLARQIGDELKAAARDDPTPVGVVACNHPTAGAQSSAIWAHTL
jgi:hypothetical protein